MKREEMCLKFPRITAVRALAEADILKLESDLGYALPTEYREFLLWHNGGVPDRQCFFKDCPDGQAAAFPELLVRELECFCMIDEHGGIPCEEAEVYSLSRTRFQAEVDIRNYVPPGLCIIGMETLDELIVISVRDESYGQIGLLFADDPPRGDTTDPLTMIASSFNRFIELLAPSEEEALLLP